MLTEAMQGAVQSVAIVALIGGGGGLWMWRRMQSDAKPPKRLGDGFTDATGRRELWVSALSPKEPARLREGTR